MERCEKTTSTKVCVCVLMQDSFCFSGIRIRCLVICTSAVSAVCVCPLNKMSFCGMEFSTRAAADVPEVEDEKEEFLDVSFPRSNGALCTFGIVRTSAVCTFLEDCRGHAPLFCRVKVRWLLD